MSNTDELDRLKAENAALRKDIESMRQDLTDARNGWESATSEAHDLYRLRGDADAVREQMLDAINAAEAVLSSQKWVDHTASETIALTKLRAAIAAAGEA